MGKENIHIYFLGENTHKQASDAPKNLDEKMLLDWANKNLGIFSFDTPFQRNAAQSLYSEANKAPKQD